MDYDIHVGAIGGFPGKLLAASLPVTGFLIWYSRTLKKKKKHPYAIKATRAAKHEFAIDQIQKFPD